MQAPLSRYHALFGRRCRPARTWPASAAEGASADALCHGPCANRSTRGHGQGNIEAQAQEEGQRNGYPHAFALAKHGPSLSHRRLASQRERERERAVIGQGRCSCVRRGGTSRAAIMLVQLSLCGTSSNTLRLVRSGSLNALLSLTSWAKGRRSVPRALAAGSTIVAHAHTCACSCAVMRHQ